MRVTDLSDVASLASAGDVNGDGFADAVVGTAGPGEGVIRRVLVYFGGPNGLSTTSITLVSPINPLPLFGWSASSTGDVNRDAFADVVGEAPDLGFQASYAYVYLGGRQGLSATTKRNPASATVGLISTLPHQFTFSSEPPKWVGKPLK